MGAGHRALTVFHAVEGLHAEVVAELRALAVFHAVEVLHAEVVAELRALAAEVVQAGRP